MQEKEKRGRTRRKMILLACITAVFGIMGTFVYSISNKISEEMSASAIDNLSESLELLGGSIEAILKKEAEFQKLLAKEMSVMEDPGGFIRSYERNETMVKLSMIPDGETEGISNTGEVFSEEGLDFSSGRTVEELSFSQSYLNDMGTWAYTIKCPVSREDGKGATLYIEYIYDSFDKVLPAKFYNNNANLYIMDTESERMVLTPKGMGERDAGHLNLKDFYRANRILEEEIQAEVAKCIGNKENIMFYHDVQDEEALIYMWSVNEGSMYLIGYVPIGAIQREGKAVNQNIFIVIVVMLTAFFLCCIFYFANNRQQEKNRREREKEREQHHEQIKNALQAAQAANQSKTMFLSNMSHDIRTPMNAILGFATLLAKDADRPEKVREYTRKITASGQHLLGLINDVLDISKIESGKAVLTMGEFSLNELVSSIDAIIRPAAKDKGQNFDISVIGIRHEQLFGDETRLSQVLLNLLSNAVKYTQEGGNIWLRITGLEQRSSQYEHFRIEVEDNGYGMTQEYLKVIFDTFTRAENSTTNKVQGTGLGMAITKNIVELMGGTIDVASEVGKGSIFTVELELSVQDVTMDERFWKKMGMKSLLVVDDEEDACRNIQVLMEDTGVLVDTSFSGREALECIRSKQSAGELYDMVLLDWRMPEMDGIKTARQIRSVLSEHIPILLLTASDWDIIEEEALQAGIDGYLAKPFFVSAFKEKLLELHTEQGHELGQEDLGSSLEGSLAGWHFLVAEDNEINAEILSELLDIEEATCEIVENGKLAVERFENAEEGTFAAILMDVQMPVMNGYEAAAEIRALERSDAKSIPIIAMTANAFAEDVKDAMDAGMNAHVSKPIDMELLKESIHQQLR